MSDDERTTDRSDLELPRPRFGHDAHVARMPSRQTHDTAVHTFRLHQRAPALIAVVSERREEYRPAEEVIAQDGSDPVITQHETVQPSRDDLEYWAGGLADPYLDGALLRALTPVPAAVPSPAGTSVPMAPAPPSATPASRSLADAPIAVRDPFRVYAEGDEILRGQLAALSATQLRNIVRAHSLGDMPLHELERTGKPELPRIIMAAVEKAARHT